MIALALAPAVLTGALAWGASPVPARTGIGGSSAVVAPSGGEAEAVSIVADRVWVDDGVAEGAGRVSMTLDGRRIDAEHFRLQVDEDVLVLERGRWDRLEGPVTFERAEIALGDGSGLLVQARAEARGGHWRVAADTLVWESAGSRARAEGARLSLCSCDAPPWSVSASEVTVRVDDVATFRAGWLEICERPVVPLPAGGVALTDRRTGLLAPQVSWGRDGAVLGAPVMVRAGDHADVVVTPEWRQQRGARASADIRYALAPGEGGAVSVSAGSDAIEEAWRGRIGVDHGWSPGPFRTALRGGWVSDTAVFTDFGEDLIARTAPWAELLGVAAMGPVRVELDRFTADAPLPQRPLSVATTAWGRRVGGLAVGAGARIDGITLIDGPSGSPDAALRPLARMGADGGRWWGPVRTDLGVRGQASRPLGADVARVQGRMRSRAVLGLWGDVGGLRHVAELGVAGDLASSGGAAPSMPDESSGRRWGAGPVLRSTWFGRGSTPLSLRASAPVTPTGLEPQAAVRVRQGAWQARAQAARALQSGAVAWDDGVGTLAVGLVHRGPLLWADGRAGWALPGPLRGMRPAYTARVDLVDRSLLHHGPALRWTSACDCLRVDAGVVWSADRDVPDVRVQLGLR